MPGHPVQSGGCRTQPLAHQQRNPSDLSWGNGELSLTEGIREIALGCFRGNTSLTGITLPASLEVIGDGAFQGCSTLKDLVCLASSPPSLGASAFQYRHADLKIYVPDESLDAYKAAATWSELASIIHGLSSR